MDNVTLSCLNCASELGCFKNSWIGIGNSYFSPVYPPVTYINGFEATGSVFAKGPDGSAVQNSVLQDLACRKCATVVGLRVDDAPPGILKKNQLILRLAEMNVVSEQTGDQVAVSVQQKIPLVKPGTKKRLMDRRAATMQPMMRHQTRLVEQVEPSSVNGTMGPTTQDVQRNGTVRSSSWVEDALKSQQKDVDRISGSLAHVENHIQSFKDFMVEVRAELAANRATRKTQEELNQAQLSWTQEDLKELREEIGGFKQDLREEVIPDIRHQLDQIREEIDSHDRTKGYPKGSDLSASLAKFEGELLEIRRKSYEIDKLKTDLQRLLMRLSDLEGNDRDSFPKTLITPNESSKIESGMIGMAAVAKKQTQVMLQAPLDEGASSAMDRNASTNRNPPGAFPDSTTDISAVSLNGIAQPKRRHDQVDSDAEELRTRYATKKRRQSGRSSEKQLMGMDQALRSPSFGPGTSKRCMALIKSPGRGSPELGGESRLRSPHSKFATSDIATGFQSHDQRHDRGKEVNNKALDDQSDRLNRVRVVHQRQRSEDELGLLPPPVTPRTPASRTRKPVPGPKTNVSLVPNVDNQAVIPGEFPSGHEDLGIAVPNAEPGDVKSQAISFDPRTGSTKPFKCGSCAKEFKNPSSMRYHKERSSCKADPKDIIPKIFKCPSCCIELSFSGLASHLKKTKCASFPKLREQNGKKGQAKAKDERKRSEVLSARERLVEETLERES